MAINWALPVGHSYRAAANPAQYLQLGRTYTQPVPGRDEAQFCSGIEVLIKPSAANTEGTVTAFLNGTLTYYDLAANTGTNGGVRAILDFEEAVNLDFLRPDSVSRLTYEYLDATSATQALRALITSYQTSAPTGDNILRTTSVREKNPGTNQKLRLRDFVTDTSKVDNFILDVFLGTQPIIVRAGDVLGRAMTYSGEFSPVRYPSYTQAVRLLFEEGTSNYINPALVLACFAAYTVTHQNLPLRSQTHHCLSEIGLETDRVNYTHPLVALLHPGGRGAAFPPGQVTMPDGTKPIAPNIAYTEYHGSFDDDDINVRWRYSPTTDNNPAGNLFTISVGDQISPTQVTPLSTGAASAATLGVIDTLWQTPALRDLLNEMGELLDFPADLLTVILAHESAGYGPRVARLEKIDDEPRVARLLTHPERLNWSLPESVKSVVELYRQLTARQTGGQGHSSGPYGGYSWGAPTTVSLNGRIDEHNKPNGQPKHTLTYRQFYALLNMERVPMISNYFASRCSPGLGQTLISTAHRALGDFQRHPRMQHPSRQQMLRNWGINPMPADTNMPSGLFNWLLDSGNSIKASFAFLFLTRAKAYIRREGNYPYFAKKHHLSHLDLPILDALHNKEKVEGRIINYASSGRARVWGINIAGEVYFKNTINAYNYLRRNPNLMRQVECYLQAPTV